MNKIRRVHYRAIYICRHHANFSAVSATHESCALLIKICTYTLRNTTSYSNMAKQRAQCRALSGRLDITKLFYCSSGSRTRFGPTPRASSASATACSQCTRSRQPPYWSNIWIGRAGVRQLGNCPPIYVCHRYITTLSVHHMSCGHKTEASHPVAQT